MYILNILCIFMVLLIKLFKMNKVNDFQKMQQNHQNIIDGVISQLPDPKNLMRMGENVVIVDFKNMPDYAEGVKISKKHNVPV